MSVHPVLAQPIKAEVAANGQLLRADLPLLRLHLQAGGREGGYLAIPQLAALAVLSNRLQMRLSRVVRVADDQDDIEMWVEASADGSVAKLAVLSWRNIEPRILPGDEDAERDRHFDALDATFTLLFDGKCRLVRVSGLAPEGFDWHQIGQMAGPVMHSLLSEGGDIVASAVSDGKSVDSLPARLHQSAQEVFLTGRAQLDVTGGIAGYLLSIARAGIVAPETPPASEGLSRGILFGRQLAPALRQPLGRIIANAETMGNALQGPIRENYSVYAKDIANAARHLVALVDDLGDLEAVERPDFSVAPDRIELGDVARRAAGLLALKAADHSIRIITPPEDSNVPAIAEFRRVLQILINLVTNAIRYSPDGTEIRIDVASKDEFAEISVSDQGQGLPIEDWDRVFDKFERLGRTGDGGSGLGLYISRRLARAMKGDLVVGQAEGGGAKFTLTLPRQNV